MAHDVAEKTITCHESHCSQSSNASSIKSRASNELVGVGQAINEVEVRARPRKLLRSPPNKKWGHDRVAPPPNGNALPQAPTAHPGTSAHVETSGIVRRRSSTASRAGSIQPVSVTRHVLEALFQSSPPHATRPRASTTSSVKPNGSRHGNNKSAPRAASADLERSRLHPKIEPSFIKRPKNIHTPHGGVVQSVTPHATERRLSTVSRVVSAGSNPASEKSKCASTKSKGSIKPVSVRHPDRQNGSHGTSTDISRIASSTKSVPTPLDSYPEELACKEDESALTQRKLTTARSIVIITVLAGVSFLNTMASGILTVSLTRMAIDLKIFIGLKFWPALVYSLAAGCTLLIFGSMADVLGAKKVWIAGSCFYAVSTVACGLARTSIQIILFRTMGGVSIAMCLPAVVSLVTTSFEAGMWRNIAFATNGMGQPLGYSVGLIVGGVFTDSIGWRWGFHLSALLNVLLSAAALFALPADSPDTNGSPWYRRLVAEIDWLGALIISTALGLLSYVLGVTNAQYTHLKNPANIASLAVSATLLVLFPFYMRLQKRRHRPGIIPNAIWRNALFTSTCVAVFFCWAAFNSFQFYAAQYLQTIYGYSALQSSLRFVPMVVAGIVTNVLTGYLVDKVHVRTLVVVSACMTLPSSILMANVKHDWSYWRGPFAALLLSPVHPDVLFTVSNLIISSAYSGEDQALAGGVFNTVAQIGNSVGLAVTGAIQSSVFDHRLAAAPGGRFVITAPGDWLRSGSVLAALAGSYTAAFYTVAGAMVIVVVVTAVWLGKGGRVGASEE
ncbi:hypothetical protein LTR28_001118 [Elasticomyces elasticus]|nr:hypothetical protein LTR28_001118 [Elasticomyces elasticus]